MLYLPSENAPAPPKPLKMAQEKHPEQDYGTLAALLNREKEQNE